MTNTGKDIEQESSFSAGGNTKLYSHFGITIWWLLTKLNIILPSNTVVTFFDIYSSNLKTYVHTKTSTCMLWVFLGGEEGRGVVSLHMNVYSSFTHNCQNLEAVKRSFRRQVRNNRLPGFWMNYGAIEANAYILSERSHSGKIKYCMIPTVRHSGKEQSGDQWLPAISESDW